MEDNILPAKKHGNTNGTSRVKGPCKLVWDIADEFYRQSISKGIPLERKRVIAFCMEQGVTFWTARAQYQAWRKANDI